MSLDATAVLFTPVVIGVVRARRAESGPSLLVTTQLANAASSFLPVSNLTNLLVFSATGLSFGGFAVRMALPTAAAAAVVVGTVVVDTPRAPLPSLDGGAGDEARRVRVARHRCDRAAHVGVLLQLAARCRARVDRGRRRGRARGRRDHQRACPTPHDRARDVTRVPAVRLRPRGGRAGGRRSRPPRRRGRRAPERRRARSRCWRWPASRRCSRTS